MARPPKSVVFAALATAFSLLGDQTLYAVPSYYESLALKPWQVGLILSMNRWIRLFTNHVAERLLARFNVTTLFAVALALGAGTTALYAGSSPFALFLIARMLWGFSWSIIRHSSWMTAADSASRENIGEVMGYYNGLSRLGSLSGNLLGAIGHDLFGWTRTLILFSGISLIGVPLGIVSQRGTDHNAKPKHTERAPFRRMIGLWVCGFVVGCVGAGMMMSTLGLVLKERVGESISVMGASIGIATLTGMLLASRWVTDGLGAPLMGAVSDRIGRRRAAFMYFGVGGVVLLAAMGMTHPACLAVAVLAFFLFGTAVTTTVGAEAAHRGSRVTASYVTAADMGSAAGPLIGWTSHQAGLSSAGIFLIGGVMYLVAARVSQSALREEPSTLDPATNG